MKKLFSILIASLLFGSLFAQLPLTSSGALETAKIKNLGFTNPGVVVQFNPYGYDTLNPSGDTLFYYLGLNHDFNGYVYLSEFYNRYPVSNATYHDTIAKVTFYQSVNGLNWRQLVKGKAQSSYTNTFDTTSFYTPYGNPGKEISFLRDTVYFESQYLGMRIISPAISRAKKSVKKRYYGSIRFNKGQIK